MTKIQEKRTQAIKLLKQGYPQKEIARKVGTSEQNITRWKKEELQKFSSIDSNIKKVSNQIDTLLSSKAPKASELKDLCYCLTTLLKVRKEIAAIDTIG